MVCDLPTDRSEHEAADARAPARADDDEIGVVRRLEKGTGRVTEDRLEPHVDARRVDTGRLRFERLDRGVRVRLLGAAEIVALRGLADDDVPAGRTRPLGRLARM
jgi:hypothetical protein